MKKNSILALSLIVVLTMLILPVSATASGNKVVFRANGKDLSYPGPGLNPSAVVVGGDWNIKITSNGKVDFKLFYKEMNLISEGEGGAPVGSVDHFTITLIEPYSVYEIYPGGCMIFGTFNIDKLAWVPEGSIPPVKHIYNFLGNQEGSIWIDAGKLDFWAGPWHLAGSVTSIQNK